MNKFKVGDRVRYIPCKDDPDKAWQNVTITRVDDEGYWGDDDNAEWRDGYFPFASHGLEPIPQPIPDRAMALIRRLAGEGDAEAQAVLAEIETVDALKEKAEQYYNDWVKDPSDMPFGQDAMLYALRRYSEELV